MDRDIQSLDGSQTFDVWLNWRIDSLHADLVRLQEIVDGGRRHFGLSGSGLVEFVRTALRAILSEGAIPVAGSQAGWVVRGDLPSEPEALVKAIVSEWQAAGQDPGLDGLWLALPDNI